MKVLGQFMRFVLNINTIWGLMILTAFLLCVVQHYQATTTRIPADCFAEGENTVTIRVLGADEDDWSKLGLCGRHNELRFASDTCEQWASP